MEAVYKIIYNYEPLSFLRYSGDPVDGNTTDEIENAFINDPVLGPAIGALE